MVYATASRRRTTRARIYAIPTKTTAAGGGGTNRIFIHEDGIHHVATIATLTIKRPRRTTATP
ncbi:MAG: hypothetical protein JAZ11_13820 [Candidatus Thiodiazotropha lotti]|nr:hypothetical protein [Candidatus Thiodiazotropha lotti]